MGEPLERSIYGRKENIQMAETLKEITTLRQIIFELSSLLTNK